MREGRERVRDNCSSTWYETKRIVAKNQGLLYVTAYPPFLTCPASIGIVAEAPASALSMAYCSESDMMDNLGAKGGVPQR